MEKKIKEKLTEYLGFDIDDMLYHKDIDVAHIFGGAIRDIISDRKINDIDILTLKNSFNNITILLEKNGYIFKEDYIVKGKLS